MAQHVIPPGGGEVVGDSSDRRVEILSDHPSLHATWSRVGAGREGADLHVHREHTDLFYVLTGELTLRLGIDDEPATVPAGTLALIPPMVVHGFRNASDADVTYLNLHAPGAGFAGFLRALRDDRPAGYDQHRPPEEGILPPSEAEFTRAEPGEPASVLADIAAIGITELAAGTPDPDGADPPAGDSEETTSFAYVLEGSTAAHDSGGRAASVAGSWLALGPESGHLAGPHHLRIDVPPKP